MTKKKTEIPDPVPPADPTQQTVTASREEVEEALASGKTMLLSDFLAKFGADHDHFLLVMKETNDFCRYVHEFMQSRVTRIRESTELSEEQKSGQINALAFAMAVVSTHLSNHYLGFMPAPEVAAVAATIAGNIQNIAATRPPDDQLN